MVFSSHFPVKFTILNCEESFIPDLSLRLVLLFSISVPAAASPEFLSARSCCFAAVFERPRCSSAKHSLSYQDAIRNFRVWAAGFSPWFNLITVYCTPEPVRLH